MEKAKGAFAPMAMLVLAACIADIDIEEEEDNTSGEEIPDEERPHGADMSTEGEPQAAALSGTFRLQAVHSSKCLDVAGAATTDGANIQQWACTDAPQQRWRLQSLGGNVYTLIAEHSGRCLDVQGASTEPAANIHQWRCHGEVNQRWELLDQGGGIYQIRTANGGRCLDVNGGAMTDGADTQLWDCNATTNQRFRLLPTSDGAALPAFCAQLPPPARSGQWQSSQVSYDGNGRLRYAQDGEKNRIPDFSYAGYRYGQVALPQIPVVETLSPASGDNTARIQAALDRAGARTPDGSGHRGAVLLQAGTYPIHGSLRINKGGVVLRGAGDGSSPSTSTILVGKGDSPHQRTLIVIGSGSGNPWTAGSATNVTSQFVQVGATRLDVADVSRFREGMEIIIKHPSSQAWINAVGGGGVVNSGRWSAGSKDITYTRRVRRIEGATLHLDAPVFNHLDRAVSQSTVAPVTQRSLIAESGIENLRVDIETRGGTDENHVWDAIAFRGAENSWARGVTVLHFGHAGFTTTNSIRITMTDVEALDPVAVRTGGRMYNFDAEGRSQLVLVSHCKATGGRHHFISNGVQTTSGIVFHRCSSNGSDSEGHRHWSQGLLFDTIAATGGVIQLINRGDYGTSHGWGSVHSVIWGHGKSMKVQKPPTAQNYAISSVGTLSTSYRFPGPRGFSQVQSGELVPASLYEAQLCDRLRN